LKRPDKPETLAAAGLFALVFCVYLLSPNGTPFDSRWTVHTALSLVHEGNADLNEYVGALERDRWYAIECVFPGGGRIYPVERRQQCEGGRFYHYYPIAVPLVAATAIGPMEWILRTARLDTRGVASVPRRKFLAGDFAGSWGIVELILASAVVSAAAVVVYLFAARLSGWRTALAVALVFAFATPAWSTGSRALWMHGFSMLLLPAGLWAIWTGRWALGGTILMLSFFIRPTNVVGLGCAGVYALVAGRKQLARYLAGGAVVAGVFAAINLSTYGTALAPFFFATRANSPSMGFHPRIGEALLGNLISPSRGLLVYSPIVLFSFLGIYRWIRDPRLRQIGVYLAAALLGHYALMAFYQDWFGGHSYGPRYMSDLSAFYALPLAALGRKGWIAAAPLIAVSVFMHAQGALCWPCVDWNSTPADILVSQHRLWDWSDPAFLRGFR